MRSSAALVLSVTLLAACSESPTSIDLCTKDADCTSGYCNVASRQCLPVSHRAPGLEVWPPSQNNQGWVVQEFPEDTLQPNGELHVQLAAGVSMEGQVYASDLDEKGGKKLIPARVVVWRDSKLPGRPAVRVETTVTPSQRGGQGNQGQTTYVLWLAKGEYTAYVVPLEPFDAQYPPVVVPRIKVQDHLKQDFVLDGEDRAVEVTGQVLDSANKPLTLEKAVPVRVRAYRPGGLGHSTLAVTDAKGAFSFKIPAGVAEYTVRVESAPGEEPIPTMECTERVLGILDTNGKQSLDEVVLPAFRFAEPYTIKVQGGADAKPVGQATVTFSTTIPVPTGNGFRECSASFTQSGITDADGKVVLRLLPGEPTKNRSYSVTVVSPAASPYASQWLAAVEVGPKGGTLQGFSLDSRYLLRGRVQSEDGQPVPGATIEAGAIGSGEIMSALPPSKASAVADPEGRFELHVDPGVYNIDIRPPSDLALPSFGLVAKSIQGNLDSVLFTVPRAKALRGRILDPAGRELGNAQVMVYDVVPEIEKPLIEKAVLRGSSVTDATGSFSLLLPPSLAD